MLLKANLIGVLLILGISCCWVGCKTKHAAKEKEIVKKPEEMDDQISDNVKAVLQFAADNNGKINDSIKLSLYHIVNSFYDQNDYHNIWSNKEKWAPLADSMYSFIEASKYYGLYPEDYHFKDLKILRQKLIDDSLAKTDAIVWTKGDLMLTDAFMKIAKDIKEGRLLPDSVSIASKQKYIDSFFVKNLAQMRNTSSVADWFNSIEPEKNGYDSLRNLLKDFVDSMDNTAYVYIDYPQKDSLKFIQHLQKRLAQAGVADSATLSPDSLLLSNEIKKFQSLRKISKDGKITSKLIKVLNNTDI
jgi:murein L,D-transpeptidase YcbB/YkuD